MKTTTQKPEGNSYVRIDKAEHWAVEHSKLTHRDPIALAACAAMGVSVAQVLQGESVEAVTSAMVKAARGYSPETADMIERATDEAGSGVEPKVTLTSVRKLRGERAIETREQERFVGRFRKALVAVCER